MNWVVAAILAIATAANAQAEPLHEHNGRLFMTVQVNGRTTEALLDSGAEATLISDGFASAAHLPKGTRQTIRGTGGATQARVVEGVVIGALNLDLHPEAVIVTDLTELSRTLIKRPTNVIVGRELFDAARLRIDIADGRIQVVERGVRPPGERLPLTAHSGIESLPVSVNGRQASAEFDLGNGSEVLISRRFAAALHLKPVGRKSGGGIGGSITRDLVRLRSLVVAGRTFRNVTAAIDLQPSANDLNVGTRILRNFLITSDFKQRFVWLQAKNG